MKTREPAVAGTFYPSSASELAQMLDTLLITEKSKIKDDLSNKKILGGVVPHAGYKYSGCESVHFFEILHQDFKVFFDTIFILNPNHHGYGPEIAVDDNDSWETPFGQVPLDRELIDALAFPLSAEAHRLEHSGEVILPFLQKFLDYEFKIVPISFLRQDPEKSIEIAERIVEINKIQNKKILIIASSDFSHYVTPEVGEKKDKKIIETILSLDIEGVFNDIKKTNATVCGCGPIMTLMHYVKKVSENPKVKLLCFGNSAKSHKALEVVDYASILFYED
ncbi:MAG: AmmeMemoRadiSam system protein B [Promethearchaeota archaeon]|jgi:AmmeMemoRadiSam system protein B